MWNAPAVNMLARIGEDQVIANSSSDSKSNTTTANFTIPWKMIEGKDVEFFCEAKDNLYDPTKNTSSEVIVTSMFCSLSTYIRIQVCTYIVIASGFFSTYNTHM